MIKKINNQMNMKEYDKQKAIQTADSDNHNKYIIKNIQKCEFISYDSMRFTLCTTSFRNEKFGFLPTQCIYVFVWI